jgi:hypothetical protein
MKIKKILVSQKTPTNISAYDELKAKYNVEIDFKPFFLIEPLTSREFRAQRINVLDYTAIVFSARHTIDAFFNLCEDLRVKIPDTMKYFCTTEIVAMYLQKYIIYRKRKIFFGDGTPASVLAQINSKHKDEKFLITSSDAKNNDVLAMLFDQAGLDYKTAVFVKSVSQDLKDVDIQSYDLAVVCNPSDVKSLQENFPDFKPGSLKFGTFGRQIVKAMEEAGLPVEFKAPTPEAASVVKSIELYLEANK